MTPREALTNLIDRLVELFQHNKGLAKTVVTRAGVDDRNVDYDDLSVVTWETIVQQAILQNRLRSLVEHAAEQTTAADLNGLLDAYERTLPPTDGGGTSGPSPRPPKWVYVVFPAVAVVVVVATLSLTSQLKPRTLTARVVDESGKPVRTGELIVGNQRVPIDKKGEAQFDLPPSARTGTTRVVAEIPGYRLAAPEAKYSLNDPKIEVRVVPSTIHVVPTASDKNWPQSTIDAIQALSPNPTPQDLDQLRIEYENGEEALWKMFRQNEPHDENFIARAEGILEIMDLIREKIPTDADAWTKLVDEADSKILGIRDTLNEKRQKRAHANS